mgnify:CR=1 FL=1|jgi:hypothetical protein
MCPSPSRLSWRSGVVGRTCLNPTSGVVVNVSLDWCGQAGIVVLELRPSGARQQPARMGQTPCSTTQIIAEKDGDAMTMRHAAPKHSNVAPRRPLKRSSEIILAAIIYLTASCLAVIGTLGVAAVAWTLWGAIGVR